MMVCMAKLTNLDLGPKGMTSRICQLLFVNATFVSHLTPCSLLLAGGCTPLPKG